MSYSNKQTLSNAIPIIVAAISAHRTIFPYSFICSGTLADLNSNNLTNSVVFLTTIYLLKIKKLNICKKYTYSNALGSSIKPIFVTNCSINVVMTLNYYYLLCWAKLVRVNYVGKHFLTSYWFSLFNFVLFTSGVLFFAPKRNQMIKTNRVRK